MFFGDNDNRNISKVIAGVNNNECEIIACIEALKIVKKTHKYVCIYTDSRLVVDAMNHQCRKLKFIDLFKELEDLESLFVMVTWSFVKGHNNTYGNEMADKLSRDCL